MIELKSKPLLRRFAIIFVGAALIPIIVLYYLYSLYDESHRFIQILDTHFSLTCLSTWKSSGLIDTSL